MRDCKERMIDLEVHALNTAGCGNGVATRTAGRTTDEHVNNQRTVIIWNYDGISHGDL